ncbi:MAG: DNA-directed RNA polymerase subunit omega, partial [Clostridia bacterium]|nr:DNA-directed RNA polymerase subunit omega [Clostridia bacterium]
MMNYPPLTDLQNKVGCRYMLVTAVAKRARQLMEDPEKLDDRKPVSTAVDELFNDKLEVVLAE